MQKVKGLFTALLIMTLLVGSIGVLQTINSKKVENTFISWEVTTLDDPRPVGD